MKTRLDEVRKRISKIDICQDDPEVAHGLEDNLVWDFIRFIVDDERGRSLEEIKLLAKEVLKSQEIDFEMWCG